MKSYIDCVVVGSGVAGMTAAIYLKRANINVLVLEKEVPGGQINRTYKIENYPGFVSIEGPELSMNMLEQLKKLMIEVNYGNVIDISKDNDLITVKTEKDEIICKSLIIATGRTPKKLGINNEEKLIGRGISYCATCDGYFFKGKDVVVVGGGNSAVEEAHFLSKICRKVYIIHRKNHFTAEKYLQDKIFSQNNIEILFNTEIKDIIEIENKINSVITNDSKEIKIDGLFIYIGQTPSTNYVNSLKIEKINDYIKVNNEMTTNIEGIFACGDVIKKDVYQITTAASDATIAANSVKKYLEERS
ncbi:MAG TPA: FAD-dependent oxidoreductase [Tenericutes bacterium]|nr:FAD-dependent oxidoreductase [Mycoplasmatota bacterium]